MERGHFVISLDTELAWGRLTEENLADFIPLFKKTREVIEQLVGLFEKYNHPVTWAIVGRLIESPCTRVDGYCNCHDDETVLDLLNAPEILDIIVKSSIDHEVACHSFEHIIFGDENCTEADADRDLSCARQVLQSHGIESTSFVFPRNKIGHLHLLEQHGFKAYRGEDITWFMNMPNLLQRFFRQLDLILAIRPEVSMPYAASDNLLDIPGHMMFRIRHKGPGRHLPPSLLAKRAIKGLQEAASSKKVFHLWFHPFNFGYKTSEHLRALEQVLKHAAGLRERNLLTISTMQGIARLTGSNSIGDTQI